MMLFSRFENVRFLKTGRVGNQRFPPMGIICSGAKLQRLLVFANPKHKAQLFCRCSHCSEVGFRHDRGVMMGNLPLAILIDVDK